MDVDIVLILIGAPLLAIGLVSNVLARMWLSPPLVALAAGVLLGPEVLDALDPSALGDEREIVGEAARITLAVSLVAIGLQMTREDLRVNLSRTGLLLSIGMVAMWGMTSLGAIIVLGVDPWVGLLIGAVLTPTDPVVASSLVEGVLPSRNLPRWLRRTLQLESGANDGLAVAFFLVPALVLTTEDGAGTIGLEVLSQLGIALGVGLALGGALAKAVDAVERHEDASTGFFLMSALAMGLLALGAVHELGGSGVLASFVAGVTFSVLLGERYVDELAEVQSGIQQVVIVPTFLLFGSVLPWDDWRTLGLSGLLFGAWVLFLRRPPAVVAALGASATPRRGIGFLGWYGPLGAAGIYYATHAESMGVAEADEVFVACSLAIALSIVVHAATATPGVRAYAGRSLTTTLRHPLKRGIEDAP